MFSQSKSDVLRQASQRPSLRWRYSPPRRRQPDERRRAALARCLAAGLIALAAVAYAAPAGAQTPAVCSNAPAAGERIRCVEDAASTADIAIGTSGLTLETTGDTESGIVGAHSGDGNIVIESDSDTIGTAGRLSHGILATHHGDTGDVTVRATHTEIETQRSGAGAFATGIFADSTADGQVRVVISGGSIVTLGDNSNGIFLEQNYTGSSPAGALVLDIGGGIAIETAGGRAYGIVAQRRSDGDIAIRLRDATLETAGALSPGVLAIQNNRLRADIAGDIRIDLLGGVRIATAGGRSHGIFVNATGNDPTVRSDITVTARGGNSIVTEGDNAHGVGAQYPDAGTGNVLMDLRGLSITTGGNGARGISALHTGTGDFDIRLSGGGVTTRGVGAFGILATKGSGGPGDIRIFSRNHRIVTESTAVDANSQITGAFGIEAARAGEGDIVIDLRGGSIETRGVQSHGIRAFNLSVEDGGNVSVRTGGGHSIATAGAEAHGIFARNYGMSAGTGDIFIDAGGSVIATGADAPGIAAGELDAGAVSGASPLGEDGYRRQTVRVNGRVYGGTGNAAGIFLAGGGRVFVGPRGLVGALSGVAVLADGTTVVDGESVPRRLLVHLTPDGRSPAALLDGIIVNDDSDGGETVYAVNGTPLYDSEEGGRTGLWAPNGARDVTLAEGFTGLDFSSADSFIDRYAPRAAVYEALPGALMRFDETDRLGLGAEGMGESAGGGRLRRPGSPLWLRLSGGFGSFGPRRATVGGRTRYSRWAAEAGMDFRLGAGFTGRAGARLVRGTARASSPAGGGRIATAGYGLAGGLAWRNDDGVYAAGRLTLTRYRADLSSSARDSLKTGATGLAHAVDLEGGRRFELGGGTRLTARAWLNRAGVSMDRFTDAVGSRVSAGKADRFAAGAGVAAGRTLRLNGGADSLALSGALGVERTLSEKSEVRVFAERLDVVGPATRLLLDAGATWRSGSLSLHAAANASGLLSRNAEYGGRLELRMAF